MQNEIASSIKDTRHKIGAEIKRLQKMLDALGSLEGEAVERAPRITKRLKAPTGALANAILVDLASGPKTNAELRESLKAGGYRFALTPEGVRQQCFALKKSKKIKADGEGQGMKYHLAK